MQKIGVICEYNPFHLGHQKQLRRIRQDFGSDCGIVCLMSGNYVQRGEPAVFDSAVRSKAAILGGADLVLELPVTCALSSAEGFASGGVAILSRLCDALCFGSETASSRELESIAEALLSPAFPAILKEHLAKGASFPAARQAAVEQMGISSDCLSLPNNILAVEYCKAILKQNSSMKPYPILREGNYHAEHPDWENPSASSLRSRIIQGGSWLNYVPAEVHDCFREASVHSLSDGERAILARLRTMTDADFEALPFGSEGLWRKLMHASRREPTIEGILSAVKSKRYTMTRLKRMVMCAFLGISAETLCEIPPYTRILAFNNRGRSILNESKESLSLINAGAHEDCAYQELENRCAALYGLFCHDRMESPCFLSEQRVYYHKES